MNYSEQQYRRQLKLDRNNHDLFMLMAVCLVLFVSLAFIKALWFFNNEDKDLARALFNRDVLALFTLPADTGQFIKQPWSLFTAMFVHDNNDVWKVFANMFWLWSFGYILQDLTGGKKIIPVFIYGTLGGMIGFVLAYNLLPALSAGLSLATLGAASCGVMAVSVVTTLVSPGYRIFPMIGGGLPLWALTALYLITSFATVSISDTGTLVNLFAAALTGLLFFFFLRRGYDWSNWMNRFFDWVSNLFNPDRPRKGKFIREELFYQSEKSPYHKTAKLTQERIDAILDKIGKEGIEVLTDEERELLKRASREDI